MATWNHPGDSVYGLAARSRRVVDTMEALLGGEVYHYHSKLTAKEPHDGGAWEWHQDYGYWYHNGCVFPLYGERDGGARPGHARERLPAGAAGLAPLRAHRARRAARRAGRRGPAARRADARSGCRSSTPRWSRATACSSMATCCTAPTRTARRNRRWTVLICYNAARNNPYLEHHHPQLHAAAEGGRRRHQARRYPVRAVARRVPRALGQSAGTEQAHRLKARAARPAAVEVCACCAPAHCRCAGSGLWSTAPLGQVPVSVTRLQDGRPPTRGRAGRPAAVTPSPARHRQRGRRHRQSRRRRALRPAPLHRWTVRLAPPGPAAAACSAGRKSAGSAWCTVSTGHRRRAAAPSSTAGRACLHRHIHRPATGRRRRAARARSVRGRGTACRRAGTLCSGLVEHRNVAQRVELLPGDALRVGDPVLFAGA